MQNKDENRYNDMLNMPHHQSEKRRHMSIHDRAAQFSPFRALNGYEESIDETARLTDEKITLHEDKIQHINEKLTEIVKKAKMKPEISVTFYRPDRLKEGGAYVRAKGLFKKVDEYEKTIVFTDGRQINIDDILDIDEI